MVGLSYGRLIPKGLSGSPAVANLEGAEGWAWKWNSEGCGRVQSRATIHAHVLVAHVTQYMEV